jgi:hypothetical protein
LGLPLPWLDSVVLPDVLGIIISLLWIVGIKHRFIKFDWRRNWVRDVIAHNAPGEPPAREEGKR